MPIASSNPVGTDLGWVNVKDYGAFGNGVADDTAAIQAAIAAAYAGSGVVYFPAGTYNYTHLDLVTGSILGALTLRGSQGYMWWGNPDTTIQAKARLHCTATDASEAMSAFQTIGLIVEDLQFSYANGYSGILLAIGRNAGAAAGTNTVLVSRCHFIANHAGTYRTAKAFIGLANTVCIYITDCSFSNAASHIRGGEDGDAPNFSNVVIISRCNFGWATVGHIVNPWTNWKITECTFEFDDAFTPCAITSDLSSMTYFSFIDVESCYFWDFNSFAVPVIQPAGVNWDIRIRNSWFHTVSDVLCQMDGTGTFIFENNTYTGSVPANSPTLIDLGSSVTAKKQVVRIVGNNWGIDGSQADVILNYAGHGFVPSAVEIHGNRGTGAWAKEPISGLASFTGPTVARSFALPDAADTIACLGTAQVYTKQQNFEAVALTSSSAHIAWNLATAQSAKHTFTESTTLDNPTNMVDGGTYILRLTQHASSPKTLAFGNAYRFPGGNPVTVSATNGAVDILTFISDGTHMDCVGQKAFA